MANNQTAGCWFIGIILVLGAFAGISMNRQGKAPVDAYTRTDPNPSQFRHPFGKKPVPSSWDGLTPEVNAYLKQTLNDYDSLKIVTTYEVTETKEGWAQRVTYRAKNALGAYIIKDSQFIIVNGVVTNEYDLG